MCTGVPKDLLTTKIDDDLFFMQECLFICYVCLYNSEVKTIVKTVKTSNPGDYKLVSPYCKEWGLFRCIGSALRMD